MRRMFLGAYRIIIKVLLDGNNSELLTQKEIKKKTT